LFRAFDEPEVAIGARRNARGEVEPAPELRDDPSVVILPILRIRVPEVAVGAGVISKGNFGRKVEFCDLAGRVMRPILFAVVR
jgi:hypothetical protein